MTDYSAVADRVVGDSLQSDIEAAQAAGDGELAQELYLKQQGTEPEDAGAGDDGSPSDIQGPPGTRLEDYRPYDALDEFEQEEEFDRVYALAEPGPAEAALRASWPGAEYAKNIEFGNAMLAAIPGSLDMVRVLEVVGLADHPALVRWVVSARRLMAGTPGDASTIPTTTEGKPMGNTRAIEARINDLQTQIEKAQSQRDGTTANRLYAEQLRLGRQLPGGTEPAIGSSGGATA